MGKIRSYRRDRQKRSKKSDGQAALNRALKVQPLTIYKSNGKIA
jgi:hypothetical protein